MLAPLAPGSLAVWLWILQNARDLLTSSLFSGHDTWGPQTVVSLLFCLSHFQGRTFRYLCAHSQGWSPELVCSPWLCVPVTSDLCSQIEAALLDLQAALLTLGQGWLSSNEYVPTSPVSWPCLHIRMTDNSVWEPVVCDSQVCCLPVCWGKRQSQAER